MPQEQKHFSASELAGVAGMPTTARAVLDRAIKEAWPSRPRAKRGGGREYPISCLPAATQAALAEKVLSAAPAQTNSSSSRFAAGASSYAKSTQAHEPALTSGSDSDPRAETIAALFDAKPEKVKAEALARLELVQEYHQLLAEGFRSGAAVAAIAHKRAVSEATLARYLALVRGQAEHLWLQLLCPRYSGRTAIAGLSAEAWETLKADYLRPERPSAAACIARLRRAAKERGWTLPSTRTLLRRLADIPRGVRVARREGMKALKALYPPQIRDKTALGALEIVNADGYKHNLWVRFADGEIARPKTVYWQDVYSSKVLAWYVSKTEHTEGFQFSFGDLCERYGIPRAATIDNTLAAANKTMSGGIKHRFRFKVREDEPLGVFKLLNVDVHWTTPGHGQAKPIERAFGIGGIGEYVDKAPEFAGAWTGSSPADKPEYDGRHRAVELAQFEAIVEREIAAYNAMPGRRGAVHQGRSFDEVFAASYQRNEIRKATDAQRRLWLLSTEPVRAASRDGALTLDAGRVRGERLANRYWHPELVDHAGRQLVARFDPRRLHQGVHVYTIDGRFICFAECDRPAAFNDATAGRERNRARNAWQRGVKLQAKAEVRMNALDAAKSLALPGAGGVADSTIPAPKVVRGSFSELLERPRYVPGERSAEERAELERIEREITAPVNVHDLRSDSDKHAHWKALNARRAAGEQLSPADEQWWAHWQTQDYYLIAVEADREFEQGLARQAKA
jgi:putative transposase